MLPTSRAMPMARPRPMVIELYTRPDESLRCLVILLRYLSRDFYSLQRLACPGATSVQKTTSLYLGLLGLDNCQRYLLPRGYPGATRYVGTTALHDTVCTDPVNSVWTLSAHTYTMAFTRTCHTLAQHRTCHRPALGSNILVTASSKPLSF